MKILFVCKANNGRSQLAEAIFNKLVEGKHQATSAGTKVVREDSNKEGQKISDINIISDIIFRGVMHYPDRELVDNLLEKLSSYKMERSFYSYSFNYCSVACGRLDGVISLTKDSFPEFAGSLLIREAGGMFTNGKGDVEFSEGDRIFIAGNKKTHKELLQLLKDSSI